MPATQIRFDELVDNLKVGVYRRTPGPKGKFLFVNSTFRRMLGYSSEEILRIYASTLYENQKQYQAINRKTCQQGSVKREEIRIKTKEGKILWCSLTAVAVKGKRNKVLWIDGFIEDISAQKQIEKELTESKELFRVVFENSAAAITVTDKNEKIIAWNPFAEKVLAMNKDDLFNKPVKDLYPAQEWRRMRAFRIREKGMLSDIETQVYRKDKSLLDVNVSISVLKDPEGNVIGSIGIMRDITTQKMAEKRIRDSENKIRVILENTAAGITLLDEDERIVSWNNFTEQMLGMTRKDLYLKSVQSLYPEKEWKKLRSENIRTIGSKHHMETKVIRKNGQVIDIDLSINVLKDTTGKIIGSVGIMQDITEQKRVQHMLLQAKLAAEEASSAKSLFLANMSHEVRTPINTIMGMIDLTLDTSLNPEQQDNLQVAKDAADNLLSLLNDILDLSRVEAGKINLEMIELNIRNIVESVCKGLSVLARNKGLEITWNIDDKVPDSLIGDPVRLRQVLLNLINNAIKFTPRGKIVVGVKIAADTDADTQLTFSIADQGIGIPKDKQERIFETFTQADDSTTRRYGGTGLGLAICKRLVEMMSGRIWVESEESKGSTFIFTALFKKGAQKDSGVQENTGAQKWPGRFRLQKKLNELYILLAEDNIVNQKMTKKLLEKRGWTVETAENGQEVLEHLNKSSAFDVILMDAHMPVLDGLETTERIRQDEKKTGKHIPIVALTARAMEEDKKKCFACGMDGYVSKPIDRVQLYETIEGLFE